MNSNRKTEPVQQGRYLLFSNKNLDAFTVRREKTGTHEMTYLLKKGSENPDRTFILVHGAFCTYESMKVLAAELARLYPESRILLVNMPWHGVFSTQEPGLEFATLDTYAAIFKDFLQTLQTKKVITGTCHWVGWSAGGSIGMLLALEDSVIGELTLLASAPVWDVFQKEMDGLLRLGLVEKIKPAYKAFLRSKLHAHISRDHRQQIIDHHEALTSAPDVMQRDLQITRPKYFNIRGKVSGIQARTLVIGGWEDTLVKAELLEELSSQIPDAVLKMYHDNHFFLLKPVIAEKVAADILKTFGP